MQRGMLSVMAGRQSFDVAVNGNGLWLCVPSKHSHPIASDLYKEISLHTVSLHTHTHTQIYLDINLLHPPPLLLNWRPSSWSGLEHCADGHEVTNVTDASGLFTDGLCSVVMFILLSNFIVLSSLFLSPQLSLSFFLFFLLCSPLSVIPFFTPTVWFLFSKHPYLSPSAIDVDEVKEKAYVWHLRGYLIRSTTPLVCLLELLAVSLLGAYFGSLVSRCVALCLILAHVWQPLSELSGCGHLQQLIICFITQGLEALKSIKKLMEKEIYFSSSLTSIQFYLLHPALPG